MLTLFVIIILKFTIFYLIMFLNSTIKIVTSLLSYSIYNKRYFFSKYLIKLCFLQKVKIYCVKIKN